MSNNCTFIDGIDRLMHRWDYKNNYLYPHFKLLSIEYVPNNYNCTSQELITLKYIITPDLDSMGLQAVIKEQTGIDVFKFTMEDMIDPLNPSIKLKLMTIDFVYPPYICVNWNTTNSVLCNEQ